MLVITLHLCKKDKKKPNKYLYLTLRTLCTRREMSITSKFFWKLNGKYLYLHLQHVVERRYKSISTFSFLTFHRRVVWQQSYRKSLCGRCRPAPISKSSRLPRPGLHFLRQQHLNSASHFTQNEGYVSQTGSNWLLPWFPHWKEQFEEGGSVGRVTWPRREMPDVMWRVW